MSAQHDGPRPATLRLLAKADKQIMKLPRSVKGAIYDFQHKFRNNPTLPGLNLEQLQGHRRLYSARVTREYRALLLHVGDLDYILVAVKHHKDVYEHLDRYAYQVNPVSGGIEFVDLAVVEDTVTPQPARRPAPAVPPTADTDGGLAPVPDAGGGPASLFAAYADDQLCDLGVARPLLPLIAKITTEDELLALAQYAPQLTGDVLIALYDGMSPDDVLEQVTRPVSADEPVDADDYQRAVTRPATQVTTEDTALQAVLEDDFSHWKVFLHPAQRRIVDRRYSGPARVSGGPGTGKTIVALHRVKHLVERLDTGMGRDVLLTTFNTNLAADLRNRLLELGGPSVADRVDIINIDKLVAQVVTESEPDIRRGMLDDQGAVGLWRDLVLELGEIGWDAEFLADEWSQVVLGQAINSRAGYFRARRAGRGRRVGRQQRAEIWQLVEQFTKRLDERRLWTFRQRAEHAARLEMARAAGGNYRYRHIVVDEAQDLSAAHWKMLRGMVPEGPDDLFIAGDTHQRLYDNYVALGNLGIHIRGRSSRLTLSYRTTHEILGSALGLLGEEPWDDLDDGTDDLSGLRSVLRGPRPVMRGEAGWERELDAIVAQVKSWNDGPAPSIAVCVPERWMVADVTSRLTEEEVAAAEIRADGPRRYDAVHVGTMHRFKGLEYQRMIIAGVSEGLVPPAYLDKYRTSDPLRYHREMQRRRSLLFVAATRARDCLVISWSDTPSPFLPATR